jgi:outer membrane biosynthesis protein TonB
MQAGISKEGLVEYVRVQSGDPTLTVAATDAVKKRKYKPLVLNGQTLPFETQVTVTFKLAIK